MSSAVLAIGLILLFVTLRLSHRFDVRVDRDEDGGSLGIRFELDADNPESRTMFRFLAAMALTSQVVTLVLFTLVSPIRAMLPVLIIYPMALVGIWRFSRYFRGAAEIRSGGIDVLTASRTLRLRWEHIRAIDVTTFRRTGGGDALFVAMMYAGVDEPFVRVKLNRSLRVDSFAGLSGPAVAGLPTGIRLYRIWLPDPESFVDAAQLYLSPSRASLPPAASLQSPTSV